MLRAFVLVGLGGACGSMARYGVNLLFQKTATDFPVATFSVNLLGCFLIGILFGLAARQQWLGTEALLVLGTGFCGGFTTFSTFALENVSLFNKQQSPTALVYTVLSIVLGILLCRAGFLITGQS